MAKQYGKDPRSTQSFTSASSVSIEVHDTVNVITGTASDSTVTFSLASASTPQPGDEVIFKVTDGGGANTLSFGSGFTASNITLTANKTQVVPFIYDGSNFVQSGSSVQID